MNSSFTGDSVMASDGTRQEVDRKYRILVFLTRADRPHYWTYSCNHCKSDVCELINCEVAASSDLVSMEDIANIGIGVRCKGAFCRYWYYFKLN